MWSGCSKSALPWPGDLVNGLVVMPLGVCVCVCWGGGSSSVLMLKQTLPLSAAMLTGDYLAERRSLSSTSGR